MAVESIIARFGLPSTAVQPAIRSRAEPGWAALASEEKTVSMVISTTGRMMGRTDMNKPGSLSSGNGSDSVRQPSRARMGMSIRLDSHRTRNRIAMAVGTEHRSPTAIIVPRLMPNVSAMIRGPGVGGTMEWVIEAPAPIARIKSR